MIGTAGLALEYGNALLTKTTAQRAIDLAVYAAAVEYSESADATRMDATAATVLRVNGVDAETLELALEAGTLRGTVSTTAPLGLTRVIRDDSSVDIGVSATVKLGPGEPTCLMALESGGSGISLRGGTTLEAPNCAAASAASVEAGCGTRIITSRLTYNSNTPPDLCKSKNNVVTDDGDPAPIERQSPTDPLANAPPRAAATSRLATASNYNGPPDSSGPDIDFSSTGNSKKIEKIIDEVATVTGCSATHSGSSWTVSCTGAQPHSFGDITIGGGASLSFVNMSGSTASQFNFQSIDHGGSEATFGPGAYSITDGIEVGGGATARFASRSSFDVGAPSPGGDAISVSGGGTLIMGSKTAAASHLRIDGNISSGGGSCFLLGAADDHIINGAIESQGAGIFGEGTYAVTGYVDFGRGGSSFCNGQRTSLYAEDVTFLVGGNNVPSNGNTCNRSAFCIGAGSRDAVIQAPDNGVFSDIAIMGPLNTPGGDATFAAGASGTEISGLLYFPTGRLTLSGGASLAGGSGGCLQLIAAEIELSGGTSAVSDCLSSAGSQNAKIRLIK